MEPEDFRNIAQGMQAIAISVAAIIGGILGVIKLYVSKELDKSRIDALRTKKDYEKKQGLNGEIGMDFGSILPNGSIPVFLQCIIVNESSETHTLDWKRFPFKEKGSNLPLTAIL